MESMGKSILSNSLQTFCSNRSDSLIMQITVPLNWAVADFSFRMVAIKQLQTRLRITWMLRQSLILMISNMHWWLPQPFRSKWHRQHRCKWSNWSMQSTSKITSHQLKLPILRYSWEAKSRACSMLLLGWASVNANHSTIATIYKSLRTCFLESMRWNVYPSFIVKWPFATWIYNSRSTTKLFPPIMLAHSDATPNCSSIYDGAPDSPSTQSNWILRQKQMPLPTKITPWIQYKEIQI